MKALKRLIAIMTLAASTLFITSSLDAQSCKIVKRGGQLIIVPQYNTQYRTPNRHRARAHRHTRNCRCYGARRHHVRPRFIYQRHVDRFYYDKRHTNSRCTFCLRYDRWKHFRRVRRGYDPIIRVYRGR